MKKLVALMLCALMVIPTFALAEEEKVLNILSWGGLRGQRHPRRL